MQGTTSIPAPELEHYSMYLKLIELFVNKLSQKQLRHFRVLDLDL